MLFNVLVLFAMEYSVDCVFARERRTSSTMAIQTIVEKKSSCWSSKPRCSSSTAVQICGEGGEILRLRRPIVGSLFPRLSCKALVARDWKVSRGAASPFKKSLNVLTLNPSSLRNWNNQCNLP